MLHFGLFKEFHQTPTQCIGIWSTALLTGHMSMCAQAELSSGLARNIRLLQYRPICYQRAAPQ